MAAFAYDNFDEAIKIAKTNLFMEGNGHTAGIHSNNQANIIKAGTTSPYSLYNESIASFKTGDMYDHHDADGFINLFGLSLKVRAMKKLENEKKNNK